MARAAAKKYFKNPIMRRADGEILKKGFVNG